MHKFYKFRSDNYINSSTIYLNSIYLDSIKNWLPVDCINLHDTNLQIRLVDELYLN